MIRYCTQCGATASSRIPSGDSLPRQVCDRCGHIHYDNPRLIVGALIEYDKGILLCRRAIEPRLGYWTLPAGFMENGETTAQGAIRETLEEAGANAILDGLFAMFSIAHINQVHLFYRGRLAVPEFSAGEESLEVALFSASEIPWDKLAFRSVELCLRHYLADRERGQFDVHETTLLPPDTFNPSSKNV